MSNHTTQAEEEYEKEQLYPSEAIPLPATKKPKGLGYLFTRPLLVLKTVNMFFNWFVNTLVYYGLTMNSTNLNTNVHLNLCISGERR